MLAVLSGAFIAVAALASEFLVRDVLDLPLAREGRYGPDIVAGIVTLLLVLKMVWRRVRSLGLPRIREHLQAAGPAGGGGNTGRLTLLGIFSVWTTLSLATYFLLFYSVMIAFELDGPGRFTTLVAVIAPVMLGQLVLITELEGLGARRRSPDTGDG